MKSMTWEEAVQWLRSQPDRQELVRACYFDDPLLDTAKRYRASEEWSAVRAYLPKAAGKALDFGAGRGISSYALASDGWKVTALEPDPSSIVGAGAIRDMAEQTELPIEVVETFAEELPFEDEMFDLVYGRQVLHHAKHLPRLCSEMGRVLKPGGVFIATREHVISRREDLQFFLKSHPLHRFYGGENAFLEREYVESISGSGLSLRQVLKTYDSVINYFPLRLDKMLCQRLASVMGRRASGYLTDENRLIGRFVLKAMTSLLSAFNNAPGRLYSFIATK